MMEIVTNTGTEIKIAVSLECSGRNMDSMDFEADFFTDSSRVVHVTKAQMTRESADSYFAVVDTAGMQSGSILMRVKADIPDPDVTDGMRTEIASIDTGIVIRR